MLELISFVKAHGAEILAAANALLVGVIAVAALFPGDQPEKTLQKIVDLIAKFSKKPTPPKVEDAHQGKTE